MSKDLRKILSTADEKYVDLVSRCLEYDPQTRMTPEDAMNHPWILEIMQKTKQLSKIRLVKKGSSEML